MNRTPPARAACAGLFTLLVAAWPLLTSAQATSPAPSSAAPPASGFVSKQVLVAPISGVDAKQVVLVAVTMEPGASSPAHMHPGDCYGSVLEGTIELRVQGQAPRRLSAGESYLTPDRAPHQFTNVGDKPVRLLNALVVDRDKPPALPASAPSR